MSDRSAWRADASGIAVPPFARRGRDALSQQAPDGLTIRWRGVLISDQPRRAMAEKGHEDQSPPLTLNGHRIERLGAEIFPPRVSRMAILSVRGHKVGSGALRFRPTLCWREMDSNFRFRARMATVLSLRALSIPLKLLEFCRKDAVACTVSPMTRQAAPAFLPMPSATPIASA